MVNDRGEVTMDKVQRKNLAILGSTGSIGTQTLDVVRAYPDKYSVYALCANRNVDKLVEQAMEFHPEVVCIADETCYEELKAKLSILHSQFSIPNSQFSILNSQFSIPKLWAGADAIAQVVTMPSIDIVVAAMVGYAGLKPTIEAIKAGKTIALANKETLVVAGEIICELALKHHAPILPVDSEHSAIFQSLVGEDRNEIEKILLTASGGPFRTYTLEQMRSVTAADALKHPNWTMGAKITIDSASMMNKGFEVIEAKWLFGVPYEKIQVLVHPQSIVHSAVQFTDGAIKAQLGAPDMRLPIQYALSFPERLKSDFPRADLLSLANLSFEAPDLERFPNLALAYEAIKRGGNSPCVLNAANEVANLAFREGRCGFLQMADVISTAMDKTTFIAKPSYDDYVETDNAARRIASELVNNK